MGLIKYMNKIPRDSLKLGVIVKLAYQTKKGVREYCWVSIITKSSIGEEIDLCGQVINSSVPSIAPGAFLDFKPENILYIWDE